MAWLVGCLYDPTHGGRATKSVDEWARIGRCSVEQAEGALDELDKNGTAEVSKNRRCHGLVTLMSRRVYREYKLKEENRLRQVRHRMSRGCNENTTILSQNGFPTVRKKDLKKDPSDPKDRSISRNEKKDPEQPSVSVSVKKFVTEKIPTPITKEDIWSFGDIVRLAAVICGEGNSKYTRNTFQKRYEVIKDHAFRSEVAMFFSELDQGEKVTFRGKALTKRLTNLMNAELTRLDIQKSLEAAATHSQPAICSMCGGAGMIPSVPMPDVDGFAEGTKGELPCGFCQAGKREMDRKGLSMSAQMEIVRHEIEVLGVDVKQFSRETPA